MLACQNFTSTVDIIDRSQAKENLQIPRFLIGKPQALLSLDPHFYLHCCSGCRTLAIEPDLATSSLPVQKKWGSRNEITSSPSGACDLRLSYLAFVTRRNRFSSCSTSPMFMSLVQVGASRVSGMTAKHQAVWKMKDLLGAPAIT